MAGLMEILRILSSNKILRDKAFNIAKNTKFDGYQRGPASIVYKFFDKKSTWLIDKSASSGTVKCQTKN